MSVLIMCMRLNISRVDPNKGITQPPSPSCDFRLLIRAMSDIYVDDDDGDASWELLSSFGSIWFLCCIKLRYYEKQRNPSGCYNDFG